MRIARLIRIVPDDGISAEIVAETGELIEEVYDRIEREAANQRFNGSCWRPLASPRST